MRKTTTAFCLAFVLCLPMAGLAADTVKIGFHAPLTGWAAADGQSALRGAQLAVQFVNADGGINGKKLEMVHYDDRIEAKESVIVARKLIESDKVVGVVSGSYSTTTRAAAPIYDRAKVPYVSTIGTHPEIPVNRNYVFQIAVMSPVHGRVGAKVASEILKAKNAVLLVMDNDFGTAVTDGFRIMAPRFNIQILKEYNYPLGEKDFRSLISNIKNDNPDVLWASGYYEEAAQIAKQAKELGLKATIIGQEGYDSPKFFELGGDATNGVIITTNLDRGSDNPMTKRFLAEFLKEYKVAGDMVAASAFDGILLLAHAIKAAGTDPDKIAETITKLKDYPDVATGPFLAFDSQRVVSRNIPVQIVKEQAFTTLTVVTDPKLITP